ncbi:ATP-binding protein [Pseudomonas alliivorans]|nr:ATP-binding protein [Pseudomonas alliivorans]
MNATLTFNLLFVSSESYGLCFCGEFSPGANIISGRNTSGKSSLIQSLLYTFGINDIKESLSEILSYHPTFRVDFSKTVDGNVENYSIVRTQKSIYVKEPTGKVVPFHGINADNSAEHIVLKEYVRNLVGFTLQLEQKGELKPAPLESMFLPYYISQSVGWVYLRESFSNLQYYKGFKDDYLDYYLGVSNSFDRVEHRQLLQRKDRLSADVSNLRRYGKKAEFQFAKLVDEEFGDQAEKYIENYVKKTKLLEEERNKYITLCNKLSLLQNHHKILKRTKSNIKKQNYNDVDRCPACTQVLTYSLEGLYSYYQKYNDTVKLESHITEQLSDKKSEIHTSNKKIKAIRYEISNDYGALVDRAVDGVTLNQWISNKANAALYRKMQADIESAEDELENIKAALDSMTTEKETISKRGIKEAEFKKIFSRYMSLLELRPLTDARYSELYNISSFPRQGVELHKTVMAYHFALNSLIEKSKSAHRLPFLLDAILKEDIDETSLNTILSFVGSNLPKDTQAFISISEHIKDETIKNETVKPIEKIKVSEIKDNYFPNDTKIFHIGEGRSERSFLSQNIDEHQEIHMSTVEITAI